MITKKDLQEAIAECEGQKNPNASTCTKLAAFYTIKDHLYPDKKEEILKTDDHYSYSIEPDVVSYDGESDFSRLINGMNMYDLLDIIDELMDTLKIVNPRLYDAVIRKLSN